MAKLGDRVRDVITGFDGIATGRAVYLNGCVHIMVTSSTLKDGEPKTEWFDEQRVEVVTADAYQPQPSTAKTGGPQPAPPRGAF
jgi:hypothetical protein